MGKSQRIFMGPLFSRGALKVFEITSDFEFFSRLPLTLFVLGTLYFAPLEVSAQRRETTQIGVDRSFGRGGLDLGWGKAEDEDEADRVTPTPSPTPGPKKEDSFFDNNVEDSGVGDKME